VAKKVKKSNFLIAAEKEKAKAKTAAPAPTPAPTTPGSPVPAPTVPAPTTPTPSGQGNQGRRIAVPRTTGTILLGPPSTSDSQQKPPEAFTFVPPVEGLAKMPRPKKKESPEGVYQELPENPVLRQNILDNLPPPPPPPPPAPQPPSTRRTIIPESSKRKPGRPYRGGFGSRGGRR
jgi:hypothetical protein